MAVRMTPQRFDELVGDALDLVPPDLAAAIDNVVILVADRNADARTARAAACAVHLSRGPRCV